MKNFAVFQVKNLRGQIVSALVDLDGSSDPVGDARRVKSVLMVEYPGVKCVHVSEQNSVTVTLNEALTEKRLFG